MKRTIPRIARLLFSIARLVLFPIWVPLFILLLLLGESIIEIRALCSDLADEWAKP